MTEGQKEKNGNVGYTETNCEIIVKERLRQDAATSVTLIGHNGQRIWCDVHMQGRLVAGSTQTLCGVAVAAGLTQTASDYKFTDEWVKKQDAKAIDYTDYGPLRSPQQICR